MNNEEDGLKVVQVLEEFGEKLSGLLEDEMKGNESESSIQISSYYLGKLSLKVYLNRPS